MYSKHASKGILVWFSPGGGNWDSAAGGQGPQRSQTNKGIMYATVTVSGTAVTFGTPTLLISSNDLYTGGYTSATSGGFAGILDFNVTADGSKWLLSVTDSSGSVHSANWGFAIKSGTVSTAGVLENATSLTTIVNPGSANARLASVFQVPGQNDKLGMMWMHSNDSANYSVTGQSDASNTTFKQGYFTIAANGTNTASSYETTTVVGDVEQASSEPQVNSAGRYCMVNGDSTNTISTGFVKWQFPTTVAQWIGINTASKTDGQTATITLPGGINENQSGMTIEGAYYVQDNGDITTAVTDYKAGIALTAGKILVDDNTVNGATNLSAYATTSALTTGLVAKAPLASPTFTGTPAAPTASVGTNTTQLATTAFVTAATAGSGGSGGSIELTANGAIGAGKAVVIDTAGTVSQVTNPPDFLQTTEQVGPTTTYNNNGGHTFYNKVKNRHVTLTGQNSGTAYVTAFTRSGTALSYGAVVNVTGNDNYTTYGAPYLIIDNVSGREFIIKADQDGIVYYSELGGTGNTVSVGGQQQIWNPGISDQHTTVFASGSKVASFGGGEFMIPVFTRATTGATVFTISTISMVIPATGVPNFGTPTQMGATDGFKVTQRWRRLKDC